MSILDGALMWWLGWGGPLGSRSRGRWKGEAYITVILSLANGALSCSIVGLALPRGCPCPCGPAGFAALLDDLEKFLAELVRFCFAGDVAEALSRGKSFEGFMAPCVVGVYMFRWWRVGGVSEERAARRREG